MKFKSISFSQFLFFIWISITYLFYNYNNEIEVKTEDEEVLDILNVHEKKKSFEPETEVKTENEEILNVSNVHEKKRLLTCNICSVEYGKFWLRIIHIKYTKISSFCFSQGASLCA